MPISEGQHQCELMLALIYPNYQTAGMPSMTILTRIC